MATQLSRRGWLAGLAAGLAALCSGRLWRTDGAGAAPFPVVGTGRSVTSYVCSVTTYYDAAGRPTAVDPGGPFVSYTYDAGTLAYSPRAPGQDTA